MQTWIHSDGTPGGATSYEARCSYSGLFLFSVQECFDVDCDGAPCGANGQFSDCSTGWCERGSSTFLQRTSIVGGKQHEATDDHACNCSVGYQTAVGSAGEVTCSTDDFQGHDECGDGGTCYDPSLLSEQALPGEFSCYSNAGSN